MCFCNMQQCVLNFIFNIKKGSNNNNIIIITIINNSFKRHDCNTITSAFTVQKLPLVLNYTPQLWRNNDLAAAAGAVISSKYM